jgi:hypothetical protein
MSLKHSLMKEASMKAGFHAGGRLPDRNRKKSGAPQRGMVMIRY